MAEQEQEQEQEQVEEQDRPDAATADGADALGDAGKQALDRMKRERSAAKREASELAAKLKEYEDRDKSETERLAARAEQAEQQLAALRSEALRSRVALSKGLPADLADRLRGDDEDTLLEDADRLLALVGKRRPAGDIDQGVRDTGRPPQLTREALAGMRPEEIVKAKQEGRLDTLLTGK